MQIEQVQLDERFFFAAGLILCLVAVGFGMASVDKPSIAAAIVSAGLAFAGGMAFLASALHGRGKPQGDGTTRAPGQ